MAADVAKRKVKHPPVAQAGRHYHDVDWHQCPPRHVRTLPEGTKVYVRGSAENRTRVPAVQAAEEADEGEWNTWFGVIVGKTDTGGDYIVEAADGRGFSDGINPYARPYGKVRVPWQAMMVIGAPAARQKGPPTAAWKPYARQWEAEREERGSSSGWREEIETANATERAKNEKTEEGKAKMKRNAERLRLTACEKSARESTAAMEEAEAKRWRRYYRQEGRQRQKEHRERSPTPEAAAMDQFLNEMYAEHGPRLEAMAANAASAARHNGNVENGTTATAKRTHEEMGADREAAEGGDKVERARAAEAEESMEVGGAAAADDRRAEHSDDDEEEEETAPVVKKKRKKRCAKNRLGRQIRRRNTRKGDM